MAFDLRKPLSAFFVFLLCILFGISLVPRVMKVQSLKARSENLDAEIRKLRVQNKALETELKMLREDPVYIEKVARSKFNKAKEGEIVYKVVRDGQAKDPSTLS